MFSVEVKFLVGIIGVLLFVVGGIMYFIFLDYIGLLFIMIFGNIIIGGCLFWMFCGIMVMCGMINFDF